MNQATGYVEAKAQNPQHENNDKDCPKHSQFLSLQAHKKNQPSCMPTRLWH
jgi:hypothetical protein